MKRRSPFVMMALALGCFISSVMAGHAAQLKVFASVALTPVLNELSPVYEKKTGNKLLITYALSVELMRRIADSEAADVIILTRAMINDLQKQNKVVAGSAADIAGTAVSVVARAGAPKPDISSVEAFRQALLTAKSVAYSDPAKGGLSGVIARRAMERLGIAEQMSGKTVLGAGAQAAVAVAKGEAELGIALASEIVPVAGVQLIGPLPGDLASKMVFASGIHIDSASAEPAKALIDFLTGPEAATTFKANGFDPG